MVTVPSVSPAPTPEPPSLPSIPFSPGTYAGTMVTAALGAIGSLANIVKTFTIPHITLDIENAPAAPYLDQPTRPTLTTISFNTPALPNPLDAALDIDGILPAQFDEDAPVLTLTNPPAAFSEMAPAEPAITTTFTDPGELEVSLPAAPSLLAINIVPFDGVTLPTFDEAAPEVDLTAPSIVPFEPGADYSSSLMTLLRSTFLTRIQDGGTGLSPDVENAIWDRGREREYKSQADAIAKLEQMEAMGFAFPPGVYMDARLKIITETDAALKGHSREVMIKQAELEQVNIQKALDQAVVLEGKFLDQWNATEQRRFETAKYQTEAQVSIFNAKVEAFKGMLDAYRAKVQVFEARIRAETQKIEVYRAQVAAEQAKAEVNKALVEQYKIASDIALSTIDIFKAKVEAIRTKAEIEKLKIEVFREQISAFTAKVNAYTSQVEAYKAGTTAEVAKQDAFKSKVSAYTAQVEAASKVIDARVALLKGQIDVKQAEYDGYKSAIQGETARVQGLAAYNTALTDQYKADAQVSSSYNDALTKQWQAQVEYIRGKAEVASQVAKMNSDLIISGANVEIEGAKAAGQIAAQIGAAALSAYNISASASVSSSSSTTHSMSGSGSDSHSESESMSESKSESKSDVNSISNSTSMNTNVSDSRSNSYVSSFGVNVSSSQSQSKVDSYSESDSTVQSTSENKNYNF